jgi:hypothetical protein
MIARCINFSISLEIKLKCQKVLKHDFIELSHFQISKINSACCFALKDTINFLNKCRKLITRKNVRYFYLILRKYFSTVPHFAQIKQMCF